MFHLPAHKVLASNPHQPGSVWQSIATPVQQQQGKALVGPFTAHVKTLNPRNGQTRLYTQERKTLKGGGKFPRQLRRARHRSLDHQPRRRGLHALPKGEPVMTARTQDPQPPILSEAALAYGNQSAARLLSKGRVERHLGRAELSVLIALAYEAGAKALLKAQEGV